MICYIVVNMMSRSMCYMGVPKSKEGFACNASQQNGTWTSDGPLTQSRPSERATHGDSLLHGILVRKGRVNLLRTQLAPNFPLVV